MVYWVIELKTKEFWLMLNAIDTREAADEKIDQLRKKFTKRRFRIVPGV